MHKKYISNFHYLTQDDIPNASHVELSEQASLGGTKWIQLRIKASPLPSLERRDELLEIAYETKKVCQSYGVTLIINDYVDIAKEIGADGVHLGKHDMTPSEARKILGNKFIIGGTANSFDDIMNLHQQNVDYIGLGPYRFTQTKKNISPVLGEEGIKVIIKRCKEISLPIPIIVIGGIQTADIETIMNCGAFGVAVSGAINFSKNRIESTMNFIRKLKK